MDKKRAKNALFVRAVAGPVRRMHFEITSAGFRKGMIIRDAVD
jgi:hypothetical protein